LLTPGAHDGWVTDPRADASVSETASGRQREVPVLLPFPRRSPALAQERPESADRIEQRAMMMWPRLNHKAVRRCCGDPARIAALIAHRTTMTREEIEAMIVDP
jgi:hypothetical protein